MSTWYLGLTPLGDIIDLGPNERGRSQHSFNMVAMKRPSNTFILEILAALEAAGVGARNVNMFGTSQAIIPDVDTAVLHVRATGGTAPEGTHNDGAGAYRRPAVQVIVTALTSAASEAMAQAAYTALLGVRNREVVA
jgi:hypothetical protein